MILFKTRRYMSIIFLKKNAFKKKGEPPLPQILMWNLMCALNRSKTLELKSKTKIQFKLTSFISRSDLVLLQTVMAGRNLTFCK